MVLAEVGPLTTTFEAAAAAVGAGVVLGGVAIGLARLALGVSRRDVEEGSLVSGYVGGGAGAVAAFVDLVLRYGG